MGGTEAGDSRRTVWAIVLSLVVLSPFAVAAAYSPEILFTLGWIVGILVIWALLVFVWWKPVEVAQQRGHPQLEAIRLCTILSLFVWPLWLVAAVWAHTSPVRGPVEQPSPAARPPVPADGPGRFCVVGVDRDSGLDTELVVDAVSAANARVKAELKGVVVTDVVRAEA